MPARDVYHDCVRNALIKDGWTITHDPYYLASGSDRVYVDLAAECPLAAERAGQKIAVEDVRDGKVWIEFDGTYDGVAEELVEVGIPRDRIVLAFKHSEIRPHTGYVTA